MSSVQVELRSMLRQYSPLALDEEIPTAEHTPSRLASRPTPRLSHAEPVIDVDEDNTEHLERRASRRMHRIDVDEPPTNRRRTTSGTQEHPVVVVDDNPVEGDGSASGSRLRHRPAEGSSSSRRRGVRNSNQQQPIVIFDSDDEQGAPDTSTRLRRGRSGRSSGSFRIFSPSPRPQGPAPPIIADPMPFAILPPAPNNEPPPPRRSRRSPIPRNDAGIYLGGGLLSQTNATRHRRAPAFSVAGLTNLVRYVTSAHQPVQRARVAVEAGNAALGRLFFNWHAHQVDELFGPGIEGEGPWARRDAVLGLGPDYEPQMTHPGRPGPGWTFDFGAEDGSAGDGGAEILVCARCLDPLLANAEGMVEVSDEERRDRRVWGLRCGHVLDGKCVGALMHPDRAEVGDGVVDGKGKGKQKELAEEQEVDDLVQSLGGKGKGKAPASLQRAPTPPSSIVGHGSPEGPIVSDNSIRSRLRSRNRPTSLPEPPSPARTTRRGHGTKRKRGVGEAEVVEDRYEWICPVAGCGRTHLSIKVGGVWKMDIEDGAVGVFV